MKPLFILCCWLLSCSPPDIGYLRHLFYSSYKSEAAANELFAVLKNTGEAGGPLITGYKGMSEIMMCYHAQNPIAKLAYFRRGKKLIETAIGNERGNAELRLLRFSVQTSTPSILCYKDNIAEDKQILVRYLDSGDHNAELYGMVLQYMLQSSYCTPAERARFQAN